MRKFQRAAVVAVAVAGLSVLGAGASFAGGFDGGTPQGVTAVANSSANAVAVGGGFNTQPHGFAPDGHKGGNEPEQGYGPQQGDEDE
ncbi:hypothetical protein ACFC09_07505 [Streptomyces sp. NPDC056161]|uniref:hypothetical protein n=1 Tax=Streptomyces sp. NPDC056161 TaxID=3345732 RepID=UPI0035D8C860